MGHQFYKYGCLPYEIRHDYDCNQLTAAGWAQCLNAGGWSTGTTAAVFANASKGAIGLGVGAPTNYNDATLTSVTGLTGTTNWQLNTTVAYTAAVSATPATFVFVATFPTGYPNGAAITEFAVAAMTANGVAVTVTPVTLPMVNHGSCTAGTKTASQTWTVTATLTFS